MVHIEYYTIENTIFVLWEKELFIVIMPCGFHFWICSDLYYIPFENDIYITYFTHALFPGTIHILLYFINKLLWQFQREAVGRTY